MCEFKVKLGAKVVAKEILAFHYTPDGQEATFSDILGRTTSLQDVLVTSVTMLPGRHEMELIQSPLVGKALELLFAVNTTENKGIDRNRVQRLLQDFTLSVQELLK